MKEKIVGVINYDDSLCLEIEPSMDAVKKIGEIFNIEYITKWFVYNVEVDEETGDAFILDTERSYTEAAKEPWFASENTKEFTIFLFCGPNSILLILLKTKAWEKYKRKLLEEFEWPQS